MAKVMVTVMREIVVMIGGLCVLHFFDRGGGGGGNEILLMQLTGDDNLSLGKMTKALGQGNRETSDK
jgi:hypothetical protein